MHQLYGYVRVSSKDQNEERQLAALEPCKIPPGNLYLDRQSGKDFARPAYQKLLRRLKPGDLLIVKSIDRFGRNYEEIIQEWKVITKQKKTDVRVLDMPLLDTTHSKDLLGTFIADLVLQILSYCAQAERENIRQRQAEGIAAAKAKGVRFGRPEVPPTAELLSAIDAWREKRISAAAAADLLAMSTRMFYYKVKKYVYLCGYNDSGKVYAQGESARGGQNAGNAQRMGLAQPSPRNDIKS